MDSYYTFDDAAMLKNATFIQNGQRVRLTNEGQLVAGRLLANGDVMHVTDAVETVAERRPDLVMPIGR